ncbi:hypothetical protein JSE7799_03011 [Jannaschia seosinensis]|uniref:Uncharacterized protein n=1 Tax=Jannaschia seosinensis TaxID=313367 RepID=A0A0M7BDL7_9RHOB|nr:hypothetical protein [Jannaschia seosinensis]CUH40279.1 hypothetical protein JSE7799_03011 [Jannaschia seosinensis]
MPDILLRNAWRQRDADPDRLNTLPDAVLAVLLQPPNGVARAVILCASGWAFCAG